MRERRPSPTSGCYNQEPMDHGMVQALSGLSLGSPVIFGSTESIRGAKLCLTRMLLRALGRLNPGWNDWSRGKEVLLKSPFGAPRLFLGGKQGPSLSFSHNDGQLWGAMCSTGSVGIDVAHPEEFVGTYPFARAFRPKDLKWAKALCNNGTARGAALLWSVKEAAVKATGTGFHLLDPLDVAVEPPRLEQHAFLFDVWADRPLSVWARTEGDGWLSVAWSCKDSGHFRNRVLLH